MAKGVRWVRCPDAEVCAMQRAEALLNIYRTRGSKGWTLARRRLTGEPDVLKGTSPVRRGAVGKVPVWVTRWPPTLQLVLAVCEQASISTTKGTVVFDPEQGRIEKPDKRERGSVFRGRVRMTPEEYAQVCDYLRSLLLPEGIAVTFNGQRLLPRPPVHTFTASLETQLADEQGVMRPTVRKTLVSLYDPLPGEVPSLYEMGLPIVETGDRWHVSVGQKVPLNRDRNNVRPA